MAEVGQSYRIVYESRNVRMGLGDVVAYVVRPDLTIVGPLAMQEMPGLFRGTYFVDYLTANVALAGEYFVRVLSPTEGAVSSLLRISFSGGGGSGGGAVYVPPSNLLATVFDGKVLGYVGRGERLRASIFHDELTAVIDAQPTVVARLSDERIDAGVNSNSIVVVTED